MSVKVESLQEGGWKAVGEAVQSPLPSGTFLPPSDHPVQSASYGALSHSVAHSLGLRHQRCLQKHTGSYDGLVVPSQGQLSRVEFGYKKLIPVGKVSWGNRQRRLRCQREERTRMETAVWGWGLGNGKSRKS